MDPRTNYNPKLEDNAEFFPEYDGFFGPSVLARVFTPLTSDFVITIIAQRPNFGEPVKHLDDIK